MIKDIKVSGSGGGSPGIDKPYEPIEDENTLQSRANIRFIDLLCEGEIEGLVNGDKSIYINNVQLQSSTGDYAFQGVTTELKTGTPASSQTALSGFQSSESEKSVNTKVTNLGGGIIRAITSSDVDDVRITLHIPSLFEQTDLGDVIKTSLAYEIYIQPDGGGYTLIHTGTKYGKCISAYQFSIKITDLSQYGSAPYNIKVVRLSADADSVKKQWDLYWATYTEIINMKLIYPDSAVIGVQLNAQLFGSQVPSRAYDVYGMKVLTPSNYDITTRVYSGVWNGTFNAAAYCNNPAWVYYDLLTNDRYGIGLDATLVDKWTLYTIAQYCDVTVEDGFGGVEPRFSFNGVISSRADAIHVINMIASNFRAMPMWASGYATISQDSPKESVKLVTNSNVVDGVFTYEGSSLRGRRTVANVSWNDPNDGYKLTVESVEDADGIERYGYRPVDITAYGCTSRGQAYRFGKWALETEQNETQIVTYKCGLDQMDVLPGSIISIADNHYAAKRMGGRVAAASVSEITLDNGIVLVAGKTYTISLVSSGGELQEDLAIDNISDGNTHTVIELSSNLAAVDVPQLDSVWIMTATNVKPRKFRVIKIMEDEPNTYSINAVYYDKNKFARVDEGKTFDPVPYTTIPDTSTPLVAPTNPWVEEYSYIDGENALFGALFSWTHTTDTRFSYYEVQNKNSTGAYSEVFQTVNNSYDFRPIEAGTYNFRVRAVGLGVRSAWLELTSKTIYADPSVPSDVSNLVVTNGTNNYTFNGKNCEIAWDALTLSTGTSASSSPSAGLPDHMEGLVDITLTKLKDYQVEVLTTADVHLRYAYTTDNKFIYTFSMNQLDNGTTIRNIKFELKARDIYGNLSTTAALIPTLGYATNPAPSMSGLTPTITNMYNGLKVDWSNITPTDNDLDKFKVYVGTAYPPTTEVAEVGVNTTYWFEFGLTPQTTYRARVVPYDVFGVGTTSDTVNGVPSKIASDDIDGELTERLVWTDSSSRTTAQLATLYNKTTSSGGITYNSGNWVSVSFPMESIQDRIAVWANKSFNCFIGYKDQVDTDWHYLKAQSNHALSTAGRLFAAASLADASTNYWTAAAGSANINIALFPQGLIAKSLALFILTNTTIVYEVIFVDQVIAESIIANELSAISANLGTIAAGTMQSTDLAADAGMLINLNNDKITMGGTVDKSIVIDGAAKSITLTANGNLAIGDSGTIEVGANGNIDIGSFGTLTISEGGKLTVGSDNIILDGSQNAIIVAPDGGIIGNDYALLKDGNLTFFYWDGTQHVTYKSVKRVVSGICNPADGRAYTLPGIWKDVPEIILAYDNIDVYQANRPTQTQTLLLDTGAVIRSGLTWIFYPKAQLVLGAGSGSTGVLGPYNQFATGNWEQPNTSVPAGSCLPSSYWFGSSVNTVSPAQNSITVTGNTHSYCWSYYKDGEAQKHCLWWKVQFRMRLYVNGAHVVSSPLLTTSRYAPTGWTVSYTGSVSSYGIYFEYVGWLGDGIASRSSCPLAGFSGEAGKYTTGNITGSTGGISGTTIIANGSLKYIAIGE